MKTNQVLIREGIPAQRTKDGYFNANALLDSYLSKDTKSKKSLDFYKRQKGFKEFVAYLKEEKGIYNPIKVGRGRNAETWVHPYLIVDFALYLSLEFKVMAYGWVLDGLVSSRTDAGDYYNEMSASLLNYYVNILKRKPSQFAFINEANLIKRLLGIDKSRNELTEGQLNNITVLQKLNASLLDKGVGKQYRIKQLEQLAEAIK